MLSSRFISLEVEACILIGANGIGDMVRLVLHERLRTLKILGSLQPFFAYNNSLQLILFDFIDKFFYLFGPFRIELFFIRFQVP